MIHFFSARVLGILAGTALALAPAQQAPPAPDRPSAIPMQTAQAGVTVNPSSGPIGTQVTLKGAGLAGATKVMFHPAAEADFTVVDDSTLKATVPAGAMSGPVQVVTPKGTLKSMDSFLVPPS